VIRIDHPVEILEGSFERRTGTVASVTGHHISIWPDGVSRKDLPVIVPWSSIREVKSL
jgi:hypothetical protein